MARDLLAAKTQARQPLEITVPIGPNANKPAPPRDLLSGRKGGQGSAADPFMQGITFGAADEIAGGIGGLTNMVRGKPYLEGYRATRDNVRGNLETYREENPGKAIAAEIGGALVTAPFTGSLNVARGLGLGAGVAGRAANAAATGAAYGGAYGAGATEGGLADRSAGAGIGAATGLATGAVASPVLDGIGAVARGVGNRVGSAVRSAVNPEAEATRRIAAARQRDITAGATVLNPADEAIAARSGQPVANIDRGGETVRALGRSAANTSPEARETLSRAIDNRFEGQGDRATNFLRGLIRTHGNATATRDALQDAARTSRAPHYRRAYADGAGGVLTPRLEQIAQAPLVQRAMRQAQTSIQNKGAAGRAMNPVAPNGTPTLEFWDQVQRNLRSAWNVANRQGNTELAADIAALRRALLDDLDNAVPTFRTARGVAATLFRADDALEAGENFVMANIPLAQARRAFAQMTPEEQDLFREGFISSLLDKIERIGDRRNVVNQIWGTAQARQKIEMVVGPARSRELEAFMRVESIMDRARGAIQGNSTTARQLAELGLAGGAYGLGTGGNVMDPNASAITNALILYGAARGHRAIDQRVAQRVGEMLASPEPAVFQRGLRTVAGNSRLLDALRRAVTQGVAPVAPREAIGGAAPAIAEDNQRP